MTAIPTIFSHHPELFILSSSPRACHPEFFTQGLSS